MTFEYEDDGEDDESLKFCLHYVEKHFYSPLNESKVTGDSLVEYDEKVDDEEISKDPIKPIDP